MPSEVKQGFRFGISFYLIAMLFILFDIEVDLPLPDRRPAAGVRDLRADRDGRLHRAPHGRVRLRLATGRSSGDSPARALEIIAESRARRTTSACASCGPATCSAATSRATSSSSTSQERVLTTTLDKAVNWARGNSMFPATFGLACCAIEMMSIVGARARHRPLRLRGLPRLAAPGRPADPLGPRLDQDGADRPAHLRPDARARSGPSRWARARRRWASSTTTPSSRPTSSCRSTSTCPAARRAPRR